MRMKILAYIYWYLIIPLTAPVDETLLGLKTEWIVVIAFCMLLIFLACGFSLIVCICRRSINRNMSGKASAATAATSVYSHSNQQVEGNDSKHLNFYRPAVLGEIPKQFYSRSSHIWKLILVFHPRKKFSDYLHISLRKSTVMIRPCCRITWMTTWPTVTTTKRNGSSEEDNVKTSTAMESTRANLLWQ